MVTESNSRNSPRRTRAIYALLYFSEGCPIGFIWWALPTWLRSEGVSLTRITGLTALLVLPWTLKFLWAPMVDGFRTSRWGYRAWILTSQVAMGVALLPVAVLDPARDFALLSGCLLVHALSAATQDVAIDALAIRSVSAAERGALNGWMQAGMLCGRSLFGGGALLLLTLIGPAWVVGLLVTCTVATGALVWRLGEPAPPVVVGAGWRALLGELLLPKNRQFWRALAFGLLSAAGFEATGALAGPFLIDQGLTEQSIGWFFGGPVVAATVTGGLLGGWWSDRLGRRRALQLFLGAFVFWIWVLAVMEWSWAGRFSPWWWLLVLTGLYFCIGLFVTASYAWFMDAIDPKHGGTQFSACMSATNGCESWSAWAGGQLAERFGYATAIAVLSLVSVASLRLLRDEGSSRSRMVE